MDRAYIFPRNVEVEKENIAQATSVSIRTSYDVLYQASSYERLRCVYVGCLEPLSPVRKDTYLDVVSHFAHRPATYGSPYCPYRTVSWSDSTSTSTRNNEPYRRNIRKLIESRLYEELLRKLPGAKISISDDHKREPRIQIDGLTRPLLILSIAPHDESLWKEPFNGTVEGRQVLFFIAGPDIPYLNTKEVNQKLLSKSSAITVYVPTEDGQDFSFRVPGEIPGADSPAAPLDQLGLVYVNYQTLFGLSRSSEYLFIKSPQKGPIDSIDQQLTNALPSLTRTLMQEEKQTLTREFEAKRKELQVRINKLEDEQKTHTAQFETKRKEMQSSIKKLEDSNQILTVQLEQKRKQHEDESYLRKQFAAEADKLKNEIAERQKSEAALREQVNAKTRELENEKKRTEKLANALQTLDKNPLSRVFLTYYKIQPN